MGAFIILKSFIGLPLIFFIPGYLIYNTLVREKLNLGFFEVVFLQILASILISGWIGLTLAELGYFSLLNLLFLLIILSAFLFWKNKRIFTLKSYPKPKLNREPLLLIVILLIAMGLFFHPYEWIKGSRDPGVYINTGVNIAKTGSIIIHDPLMESMDNSTKEIFYQFINNPEVLNKIKFEGKQFPGFYITDKRSGEITPQFFYLWPVWIGIFYSISGLKVGLYITPLFALLAILSVFFTGKALFNRNVGIIASLLLTLNFAQIWYARYPTTEVFTQFLIFSGIFTFIIFNRTSSRFFGIVSALCFGETLLTRIDAVFLVIPIALFFGYLRLHDRLRKEHMYFIAPFSILSIHAIFIATFIATPYTYDIFRDISYKTLTIMTDRTYLATMLFAILVIILVLVDLNKNIIVKKTERINKYTPHAQHFIAVSIVILAVYAYFIRPGPPLIDSDRFNMIKLSWYLTELGVALAIIGLIIMIYRNPSKDVFLFFGIISIYGLYYINNAHITPDHPWWIRRYLPVVVPSFLISAGVALDWIKSSSFLGKGISFVLILFLIISFVQADEPVMGYVEHRGLIDQTRELSTFIADDGRIIFMKNGPREFLGSYTSTPLYFIYNKEALRVRNNPAYHTKLIEKLKEWENSGKKVLITHTNEDLLYKLSKNFKLTAEKFPFNYRQLAQHPSYYQVNLSGKKYPLSYRMEPLTIPPLRTYNLTVYRLEEMKNVDQLLIDMGNNGTGYIKGFYGRELSQENVTFRWTRENARVNAPGLGNDSPLLMELRSPNWRPNRFPANISFSANGHELQNYTLISEDRFKLYRLTIPQDFLNERYLEIKIHTDTWNPSKTMNSTDNRNLGIAVDWISLENLEN